MELVRAIPPTSPRLRGGVSTRILANGGTRDRRDVFHVSFDPATEPPVVVIVEAVAVINDTPVEALAPIEDTVDTDALRALVRHSSTDVEVSFAYEALEITIDTDGDLWIRRM